MEIPNTKYRLLQLLKREQITNALWSLELAIINLGVAEREVAAELKLFRRGKKVKRSGCLQCWVVRDRLERLIFLVEM